METFTQQWCGDDVNTEGTREELFVPVSKNDIALKFDFLVCGS